MGKVYKETYFQHDRYARQDPKIKKMLTVFRKESELKAKASVCIYWWIVEDMHTNSYPISELDTFADDYRCDVDFLKSILEDFELFRIENDCYISDRVLRNLEEQEEKRKKAKASAQKRWNRQPKDEVSKEETQTSEPAQIPEYDEEFVMQIIKIYNEKFKKSQIVSKPNKERIFRIHHENNLTLDIWQKVFSNAKRGWDISGKQNVKPTLKKILDEWDSFASNDYFLAPDREALKEQQEQEKIKKEQEKEEQAKISKLQEEEKEKMYQTIKDKLGAYEFLCRYVPSVRIDNDTIIRRNSTFKEFSEKYGVELEEYKACLKDFLAKKNGVQNG